MNIQSLLEDKSSKKSSIIKIGHLEGNHSKLDYERCKRKNSSENFGLKGKDFLSEENMVSTNSSKLKRRGSRVVT